MTAPAAARRALRGRASVRLLLLGLVLACLIPGVLGVGALMVRMFQDDRAQTEREAIQTARALTQAVDAELARARTVVLALATSSFFERGDLAGFHRRAATLLATEGIGTSVGLSDATGRMVVNTLRPFGEPLPQHGNPERLRQVFEATGPLAATVSDVFIDDVTGKATLTIDAPVVERGRVVYAVSLALAPQYLGDLLSHQKLPPDWISSISDRGGTTAARSHQPERFIGKPINPDLQRQMKTASDGAIESVTRDGIPAVIAFSRSPETGWTVAIAVPRRVIEAEWRHVLLQSGIGAIALFAVGIAFAWHQGGRIARSVQGLTDSVVAMARGETMQPPELHFSEADRAAEAITQSVKLLDDRAREQQALHDALRASKAMLDTALASMSDAVFISDTVGHFVEMNEAFATFHKFASKEECLRTFGEYPDLLDVFMADGSVAPIEQWAIPRALHGETATNAEFRLRRRDTGETWFGSYSFAPIRGPGGEIVGAVVAARDITEQKQREQALVQAMDRLSLAQRAAGAGVWDWDIAANSFTGSDELYRLFGLDPHRADAGFGALRAVVHPDDLAKLPPLTSATVRTLASTGVQVRVVLPSGEPRWIETLGDTSFDAHGQALRISGICIDVTARKLIEDARARAEQLEAENRQIQEASRLKSEFLANMSHELRTPLNAIIGFAELLHSGMVKPDAPEHQVFLAHIGTSGRHLLQLINDVLDLSKVEAGKLDFFPEPTDLAALIGEVGDILHASIAAKKLRLSVAIDPALGALVLDPARLRQALYNFLSNAIKFTPDGGYIEIRARPEGATDFRLEVEDNGIGIAADDIPRLFKDFQQLDASSAKQHQGTGLGLTLTRRLIQAQGGQVGVRSAPGVGSVFHLVLARIHGTAASERPAPVEVTVRDHARTAH